MDAEASRTCVAALSILLVELAMTPSAVETIATPSAATRMFEDISAVTALCSSTAEAMAVAISLIVEIVEAMSRMASTAEPVDS
jgi:hypothetical protein